MLANPQLPVSALPSAIPENAPEHCPGVDSDRAGLESACAGCPNQDVCKTTPKGPDPDLPAIRERMANVKRKILVLSGKGGVGKSTVASMLGYALAADPDVQTGIMDIDITGPSQPLMLGLSSGRLHSTSTGWSPLYVTDNLCAMSIGFMLPSSSSAVIWRGPKKNGLIKQFLKDVDWGALDYLVVDTPPGTSDEHLSIVQFLRDSASKDVELNEAQRAALRKKYGYDEAVAVVVTTPQEVSLQDVRRELDFCRKLGVPVLGVVENMSGFVCPSCGGESEIFVPSTGGAGAMAKEMGTRLLGSVPLDPRIGKSGDYGESFLDEYPDSRAAKSYLDIVDEIRRLVDGEA